MPNQHKNPGVSWHPSDPTLKKRLVAEAERRRITLRELLDEMASAWLKALARVDLRDKQIRHVDGDPLNNDPSNLEIRETP